MLLRLDDAVPSVDPSAWVASTAVLTGAVEVGPQASLWYGVVARADLDRIVIGARSNVQDNGVLHTDPGLQLVVGDDVTVGHRAVLHGCRVGDGTLVGMGSVVMNGCDIGESSLVAAGSLLVEGTAVPPRSLVMGSPAKVRRELTDEEVQVLRLGAAGYVELAQRHARATM